LILNLRHKKKRKFLLQELVWSCLNRRLKITTCWLSRHARRSTWRWNTRSKGGNTPSKPRMITNLANKSHPWENSENSLVFLEAASHVRLHMNKQKLFAVLFPALVRIYTNFLLNWVWECMFVEWLTRATSNLKNRVRVRLVDLIFLFFFFFVIWPTFIIFFFFVFKCEIFFEPKHLYLDRRTSSARS